jgi:hypothetical protein
MDKSIALQGNALTKILEIVRHYLIEIVFKRLDRVKMPCLLARHLTSIIILIRTTAPIKLFCRKGGRGLTWKLGLILGDVPILTFDIYSNK